MATETNSLDSLDQMVEQIDPNLIESDPELAEAVEKVKESESVEDEATRDEVVTPVQYEVSSYGADYDVEGLVRRLDRGDIFIPRFQREFVWNEAEASRFIESLLLGLPVPGIFLAKEAQTNKLLVIDGQQRLKTLLFFYKGEFNPGSESKRKTVFRLSKVQDVFQNCTYQSLAEKDRRKLDESIIHATVIKQEHPEEEDTDVGESIYHVFERLNNGGRKLTAQEIRAAIFHGPFLDLLGDLNMNESWRSIFGPKSKRLKDQEMILRFLAFYFERTNYAKPMTEFLNRFARRHRLPDPDFLAISRTIFENTMQLIWSSLGRIAFRTGRPINVAVFDAVTYGVAQRISVSSLSEAGLKSAYVKLVSDEEFIKLVSSGTSDENNVDSRLEMSLNAFEDVA